jgi:hypothetical protein
MPGDANLDGQVNGADLLVWKANVGRVADNGDLSGDFNNDGLVNGDDLLIWRSHLGRRGLSDNYPLTVAILGLACAGFSGRLRK